MIVKIKTLETDSIKPFLKKLFIPSPQSHKGQNGKVLIIGGSHLFHAASIWSAQTASHFADMVHYASTIENNEIILSLKKKFINGIVVRQEHVEDYINEDDSILIGPGMVRAGDEGKLTYKLTKYLLHKFPEKRWVIDAGALQMLETDWLKQLKTTPIITPHQLEFGNLFQINIKDKSLEEKIKIVEEKAKSYNCVILLKAIVDIISDGRQTVIIKGGNPGLTKGGTGDVLAGLIVSLYAKNDTLTSAVVASYLLKKTADSLSKSKGFWYNTDDIINFIPNTLNSLFFERNEVESRSNG